MGCPILKNIPGIEAWNRSHIHRYLYQNSYRNHGEFRAWVVRGAKVWAEPLMRRIGFAL